MRDKSVRFIKNFFRALGHGVLQEMDVTDLLGEGLGGLEGVIGVLCMAAFCCLAYAFFQVGYELMFDPNSTDVATRLAGISINPEKWM